MARIVKCGLIQASCDWETPKYSLNQIKEKMIEKHVGMVEKAGKEGVQILSLQEIFYGPYFCAEQDDKWYDTAEPIPGPTTGLMQHRRRRQTPRRLPQEPHPPLRAGLLGEVLLQAGQSRLPGLPNEICESGRLHLL